MSEIGEMGATFHFKEEIEEILRDGGFERLLTLDYTTKERLNKLINIDDEDSREINYDFTEKEEDSRFIGKKNGNLDFDELYSRSAILGLPNTARPVGFLAGITTPDIEKFIYLKDIDTPTDRKANLDIARTAKLTPQQERVSEKIPFVDRSGIYDNPVRVSFKEPKKNIIEDKDYFSRNIILLLYDLIYRGDPLGFLAGITRGRELERIVLQDSGILDKRFFLDLISAAESLSRLNNDNVPYFRDISEPSDRRVKLDIPKAANLPNERISEKIPVRDDNIYGRRVEFDLSTLSQPVGFLAGITSPRNRFYLYDTSEPFDKRINLGLKSEVKKDVINDKNNFYSMLVKREFMDRLRYLGNPRGIIHDPLRMSLKTFINLHELYQDLEKITFRDTELYDKKFIFDLSKTTERINTRDENLRDFFTRLAFNEEKNELLRDGDLSYNTMEIDLRNLYYEPVGFLAGITRKRIEGVLLNDRNNLTIDKFLGLKTSRLDTSFRDVFNSGDNEIRVEFKEAIENILRDISIYNRIANLEFTKDVANNKINIRDMNTLAHMSAVRSLLVNNDDEKFTKFNDNYFMIELKARLLEDYFYWLGNTDTIIRDLYDEENLPPRHVNLNLFNYYPEGDPVGLLAGITRSYNDPSEYFNFNFKDSNLRSRDVVIDISKSLLAALLMDKWLLNLRDGGLSREINLEFRENQISFDENNRRVIRSPESIFNASPVDIIRDSWNITRMIEFALSEANMVIARDMNMLVGRDVVYDKEEMVFRSKFMDKNKIYDEEVSMSFDETYGVDIGRSISYKKIANDRNMLVSRAVDLDLNEMSPKGFPLGWLAGITTPNPERFNVLDDMDRNTEIELFDKNNNSIIKQNTNGHTFLLDRLNELTGTTYPDSEPLGLLAGITKPHERLTITPIKGTPIGFLAGITIGTELETTFNHSISTELRGDFLTEIKEYHNGRLRKIRRTNNL